MHSMKNRRGRKGQLALKLDVSKAYDRAEWSFLKGIFLKLGFPIFWVDLRMGCVTIPSYAVLINGKPYGHIIPSRGLWQGDLLSLYLFFLYVEGFTSLLQKAELEGQIHGVSICKRAPTISHLLFADDSLLFCHTNQNEVTEINEILQLYAEASGQCINMEKSSIFFNSNTNQQQHLTVKNLFGVREVQRFESYFGLPTLIGRAKYQTFLVLEDRVWKKLQGWKGKLLFRVGKEILIKVVAQSILTYTMGVF